MAKGIVKVDGLELLAGLEAADIPDLAASQVSSGTLDAARIPSLDASAKITDGTITVEKLNATLLKYLVPVARIGSAHIGFCKIG